MSEATATVGPFEAAAHLLAHSCLAEVANLVVDRDHRRIRWPLLEGRLLSRGEALVVDGARSLYNGSGVASLSELIDALDDDNWSAFVEAIALRRPLVP